MPDVALCCVPSHSATARLSGINAVAKDLASTGQFLDLTDCLVRHTTVPKKSYGGNRSVEQDRESLRIENPNLLFGKKIVLLDDVVTTGQSMFTCAELLRGAGILDIRFLAIGRTDGRASPRVDHLVSDSEANHHLKRLYDQRFANNRIEVPNEQAQSHSAISTVQAFESKIARERLFDIIFFDITLLVPGEEHMARKIGPEEFSEIEMSNKGILFGLCGDPANGIEENRESLNRRFPDLHWSPELSKDLKTETLDDFISSFNPTSTLRLGLFRRIRKSENKGQRRRFVTFIVGKGPKKEVWAQDPGERPVLLGERMSLTELIVEHARSRRGSC